MPETAVFNASPLIALANAGHPNVVRAAGDRLIVPAAVLAELSIRGRTDPAVALIQSERLEVAAAATIPPDIAVEQLGAGESAVLALASSYPGATLILDDWAARRAATARGMIVHGTLWLVVRAKQKGIVAAAKPVLDDLSRAGLFLPPALVNSVLRAAGE